MTSVLFHDYPWSRAAAFAALMTCFLAFPDSAAAETYRIGPDLPLTSVSQITSRLKPGDTVEITGDISDSFILARHGTREKPIVIRGVTWVEEGRIVRPKIRFPKDAPCGIICRGAWNIIEGLDISGAVDPETFMTGSAIYSQADNLVVRNCYIHHNRQGVYCDDYLSGSTTIEFCEFDSNGGVSGFDANMHSVFLCSRKPGALSVIQHCYFHDAIGGVFVKTRCPLNVIRYNWFENPYYSALTAVDLEQLFALDALYPMHTDIVSNVFFQGWSPGPQYSLLSLGGEHETIPGTEGDFNIAHNLFVVTKRRSTPCLLVHGNVDHVNLYNNVFLDFGVNDWRVYERGTVWDVPRTKAFLERRGTGDPIIAGACNWISRKADGVPEFLKNTARGTNPKFIGLDTLDFRPAKDSPLARAALSPLSKGRIVDLDPEFEPRRGIPDDLKRVSRRKVEHPAIGPFEVPE